MYRMDVGRILKTLLKPAAVLALGFLGLFGQPAHAQGPLNYFKNYFVTGDYVVGGVGLAKTAVTPLAGSTPSSISVTSSITLNSVPCTSGPGLTSSVVPCTASGAVPADVIAAFLYWQTTETTSTPSSAYGSFDATFPANPFVGLALGNPTIAACAASGGGTGAEFVHNYRADVLKYLPINTTANVRLANGKQTFTLVSASTSTQFVGATLVVVYRLITPGNPKIAPLRSVVIYDGAFTGTSSPAASLNQTYMGGIYQAAATPAAHMTQIVGNGKTGFTETLTVNGGIPSGVPSDPFVGAQGANWDNYSYNINLTAKASSVATEVVLTKDCLSWAAIITSTNVQDSDFDGLLDIWETSGLYFNPGVRNDGTTNAPTAATFGTCTPQNESTCLNLPAMGANPSVPDIFMQIDWMQGTYGAPHVHNPQLAALNMVGAAFKARGINLHFDVGTDNPQSPCQTGTAIGPCTYQTVPASPYIIPAAYAQGGNVVEESGNLLCPNSQVSLANCAFPSQSGEYSVLGWKSGFDAIKNGDSVLGLPQLFATNRKDTFHYALFGHAIAASTPLSAPYAASISGVGDLPGGDLMVTLGLWRSDVPAVDQVGTELDQAGTLMHELGHNLDLHHGGWNNTPVCMPNYPSVMNYLYQVAGLTDSAGIEHIDYSYGLELPLSEGALSSDLPLGILNYAVRYFGPFNSAIDTPGQASQVDCNGQILGTSLGSEGAYVRLQGASVSTPDWSNGTILPLGAPITKGLDINYDGIIGQTFFDSPDWYSLNLQQVGARPNANGLSLNVGIADIGIADIGIADIGIADIGIADIGIADIGIADIGIADIGTAALGQDALGDQDYTTYVLSGSLPAPSTLTVAVTPAAPSSPTTPPYAGGTGNYLSWTGNSGVASQYNIYRCALIAPATSCTPTLLTSVTSTTLPVPTTYIDSVNNFVQAGSTCPTSPTVATCYNTTYYYYVTEVNIVSTIAGATCANTPNACKESGGSNTVSSEVKHLFVIANSQTITYGATNPTPTYVVYSNVASATSLAGVTCAPSPSANSHGYYDAGNHPITCTGPSAVSGTTEGVTYYVSGTPALVYPTSLGGTGALPGITQGSLTVNQLPITVTAVYSTKVYNASTSAGTTSSAQSAPVSIPTITTNSLVSGDTAAFTESYDTPNVNSPIGSHVMIPAGSVNDNNGGNNYKVTFVNSAATSVITPAPLTATIVNNPSRPYNGTTAATLASTNFSLPGLQGSDNFTVTQTVGTYNSPNVLTATTVTASLAATNFTPANGTLATNYTLPTTASGPGAITPVTLTASIIGTPTKPYDGTTTATLTPANFSLSPLVGSDDFTVTQTVGAYNNPNVVSATTVTATLTSGNFTALGAMITSNYTLPNTASGPGKINPVNASIMVTPYSVTYDGNPHTAAGTATGVGTPPVNLAADLNLSGTTHTNAGTYNGDSWSFTDPTGNYNNVSSTTISDTILKANANITVTPYSVIYDGNPHTAAGTATGVGTPPVNLAADLNLSGTIHTNAGTYSTDSWSFTDPTGNYNNVASTTITDTIVKASANITVTPYNVTYNGNPQTATGAATGVGTPPANLSSELNLSGTTHTNAGTYSTDPWTFTDTTGNYNNASGTVSDTINQATPTVTDSGPAPTTPDYGQPVTLTVTIMAPPPSAGVSNGMVTFSFTLGQTTNYICSNGGISATQCSVPVTFNGTNYTASVTTTSNLPTGAENVMATYSGDPNFLGEAANNLSVTVSQASSAVTLTSSADPSTYGSPVNLTVNVADTTGGSIGVPTGTVTLSFVLDPTVPNGQVYYICGDGSVITTPPCMTPVTLAPDESVSNTATVTVPTSALPAGLATFANPGNNPPAAYSYPINAAYSGDTNFAAGSPFGLSQTVNPLPVTATAGSYSGTYNGAPQSPSACVVTPISPNTSIGTLTCTNSLTSVGPGAGSGTVTPVPAVAAGDSLNNYAITSVNGNWNIAKANASITVTGYNVTYNGSPYTATGSATGVNSTNLSSELNLSGTTHTNAGTYSTDPWTFTDTSGNYNNANGTVSDTIGRASTTTSITMVSPSPTDVGLPVTVTVTVAPVAPGTGTPTGSVTVNSSQVGVTCAIASLSGGAGSCMLTFTTPGPQSVTATYTSSSTNFNGSGPSTAVPVTVNQPVTIGPASLPAATLNFPYLPQQLTATGGSGTYTNYAVTGGTLPVGLTLSSSGLLSGTPTAAGANPVTVSVTDSLGDVVQQNYTISTGFALVGSGAVNGTGVQLTSTTGQAGAAWAGTQQSVASGFSASFQFKITAGTNSNYFADGLAFVIQGSSSGLSALGGGGGDIGYAGLTNSLAVEFDTYDDGSAPIDDPNGNHIAIISNGTGTNLASHCQTSPGPCYGGSSVLAVTNSNLAFTLTDGALHTVTITYTGGSNGTLTVSVGNTTIVTASNLNLQTLLGLPASGYAWVGFTGGSGDGGENGDIYNWSFGQ